MEAIPTNLSRLYQQLLFLSCGEFLFLVLFHKPLTSLSRLGKYLAAKLTKVIIFNIL
jgi:hypothetical protein